MKFDKDEITYKEIDKMLRIGIIVTTTFEQRILNNALDTLELLQFEVYELGMPVGEDLVMRVNLLTQLTKHFNHQSAGGQIRNVTLFTK